MASTIPSTGARALVALASRWSRSSRLRCRSFAGGRHHLLCAAASSSSTSSAAAAHLGDVDMVPPAWRDGGGSGGRSGRSAAPRERLVRARNVDPTSSFRPNSRTRLTASDARRFRGDDTFARVARAVCEAECLPRKELFETWEAALIISRSFGHRLSALRVLDMAAGHGLLAHVLLILHPECPSAVCVDRRQPHSYDHLSASLAREWPHLTGRLRFVQAKVQGATPSPDTLLVSVHACGGLTDLVLKMAVEGGAPVAVVPCCHRRDAGWDELLEGPGGLRLRLGDRPAGASMPLAMDVARLEGLRARGYKVEAKALPREVTPVNRVILGTPRRQAAAAAAAAAAAGGGDDGGGGVGGAVDGGVGPSEASAAGGPRGVDAATGSHNLSGTGWETLAATLPESPWRRYTSS